MKKIYYIVIATLLGGISFSSCRDDDFTESIFDTSVPVVDTTAATAEFDQWIYDNFITPYNCEILYRFNFPASDMDFQLTPADYRKSQLLARLIRYLYFDVYTQQAGEEFMKLYGPRIFHFIGSVGLSASTGTETLGTASGGIKITLYNVNNLPVDREWTENDITQLNHYYFHTMHHEFSHILHQTKTYPVTFGQVTPSAYDPDWQKSDSVDAHTKGFVTHYARLARTEDFVEVLSSIITDNEDTWVARITNACLNGVRKGDKERIYTLLDSLNIDITDKTAKWNKIRVERELDLDNDSAFVRYVTSRIHSGNDNAYSQKMEEHRYAYVKYKDYTSFSDYMDDVKESTADTLAGMNAILEKIDIATEWYTEKWDLHIYALREEVRQRQNNINNFLRDSVVYFEYKH